MFTGIITHTGKVQSVEPTSDMGMRLAIATNSCADRLIVGSSHSINGVCMTLLHDSLPLRFDASAETLNRTNLSTLAAGDRVNIEPAMKLGDTIDGHLVSGHVDGVGEVIALESGDESVQMTIGFPSELGKYIAIKGSVCVDGTSLTVNQINGNSFDVTIIPHTLKNTRICDYRVATKVNIEVDMIARYLERLVGERALCR